jgi:hypothetical protein
MTAYLNLYLITGEYKNVNQIPSKNCSASMHFYRKIQKYKGHVYNCNFHIVSIYDIILMLCLP